MSWIASMNEQGALNMTSLNNEQLRRNYRADLQQPRQQLKRPELTSSARRRCGKQSLSNDSKRRRADGNWKHSSTTLSPSQLTYAPTRPRYRIANAPLILSASGTAELPGPHPHAWTRPSRQSTAC